jgi:hypothetical protein
VACIDGSKCGSAPWLRRPAPCQRRGSCFDAPVMPVFGIDSIRRIDWCAPQPYDFWQIVGQHRWGNNGANEFVCVDQFDLDCQNTVEQIPIKTWLVHLARFS